MPRRRMRRCVQAEPKVDYFKPRGIPLRDLDEAVLSVEGLESLRLADLEGLTASEAAQRMGVSRHIFGRVLAEARRAVALALVEGQALRVEGGHFEVRPPEAEVETLEVSMNKVAVSSEGPGMNDRVDPRFGRAGGFVVVDMDTMSHTYVDNGQSQVLPRGAGIQAAQTVANAGAGVVLTGVVGPKAFQALDAAGIRVGQDLGGLTVAEAIERYKAGRVVFATESNK